MDFKEYQEMASRTRNRKLNSNEEMINYALGMVCEAGEVGDIIKKAGFHGHGIDLDDVVKEIGDTMWYMANLCMILGIDMQVVAEMNIEKLQKRYPEGFSNEASINRKE